MALVRGGTDAQKEQAAAALRNLTHNNADNKVAIARAGSETPAHPFASSIVNVPVRTRCSVAALDGPLKGLLPVSSRWSITPADQTSVVGVYDPSSISGDA